MIFDLITLNDTVYFEIRISHNVTYNKCDEINDSQIEYKVVWRGL